MRSTTDSAAISLFLTLSLSLCCRCIENERDIATKLPKAVAFCQREGVSSTDELAFLLAQKGLFPFMQALGPMRRWQRGRLERKLATPMQQMTLLQQTQTTQVQQVHTLKELQQVVMTGDDGNTFMQRMENMTTTTHDSTTTTMSQQLLADQGVDA